MISSYRAGRDGHLYTLNSHPLFQILDTSGGKSDEQQEEEEEEESTSIE